MKGKLIIIEAGDGCGKATQAAKLAERLKAEGKAVRQVEFPNYSSSSSALIKMYLNGEFGTDAQAVNAYAASLFFAVDRFASYKTGWAEFYQTGGIIIADRYSTSNMVHQAVKITDDKERDEFLDWLWDLEFVKMGLPQPDCVIFLDMPPAYSLKLMAERAAQTGVSADIHERDADYLSRCYDAYRLIAGRYDWNTVHCLAGDRLKTIDEIHDDVFKIVGPRL